MILRRLGALSYDLCILISIFFAFTAACLFIRKGVQIPANTRWFQITLLFLTFSYYHLSWYFAGQTIGMRAWKIKLVSTRPPLKQKQIFLRTCIFPFSFVLAPLFWKSPEKITKVITKTEYKKT